MLKVENLAKSFVMHIRDGLRIEGFKDVAFTVKKGELLAITGASGIGKSSVLKCVFRTYKPTEGSILYTSKNGEIIDIATADDRAILELRKNEIGYVSQFLQVIPRVSAMDILMKKQVIHGVDQLEAHDTAQRYLSKVGISKTLWNMYPSTFSGGEKQRMNIILALISRPRLLILDEPTASLDSNSKKWIMGLILDMKKEGTAMIGAFHDKEALNTLADSRFDMMANTLVAVS